MKVIDFMKTNCASLIKTIAVVVLGFCLASCANKSQSISEAEYSTKIVGFWQGIVGDLKESMAFNGDGTFVYQLHRTGFIANTLSQGVTGTIHGTWKITDKIITLSSTNAENESLKNRITSSKIVMFKKNELILKSSRGETSSFLRVYRL